MKTVVCSNAIGDTLVLAGGVVALSKKLGEPLRFLCNKAYYPSVSTFFLGTDIEVITLEDIVKVKEVTDILDGTGDFNNFIVSGKHVSYDYPLNPAKPWMEWIYEPLGIPFEERWNSCPIREAAKQVKQILWPEGFAFVHEDSKRGMEILSFPKEVLIKKVEPEMDISILAYVEAIENAPQVHVIDSCFFHLVECLEPKGELYLHRYAKEYTPGWDDGLRKHDWIIVDDSPHLRIRARMVNILRAVA